MLATQDERESLEEKVAELCKTLDRLEDEWGIFYRRVDLMTVSKLTDPRHPFTDWELVYLRTKAEQERFRATMTALQHRLEGKETPVAEQIDAGVVPKEVLYASSKPSVAEAVDILKKVGQLSDSNLIGVMNAIAIEFESESEFEPLARFVLDGVRIAETLTP